MGDQNHSATGQYQVNWVSSDGILANTATTASLTANGTVTSRIDTSQDADWFKLAMTAGLSYGYEVKANGLGGLTGGDIRLIDSLGNTVDTSVLYSGTVNMLNVNATATGNYFIAIADQNYGNMGAYALRWIASDNVQNNVSTGLTLARGASYSRYVDVSGDADWYKVTLKAGESYGFELKAAGANGLTGGDLRLYDGLGNLIDTSTLGSGTSNTLAFTALTSGTYFISAYEANGGTGGYSLRNVGLDTVLANAATTRSLADGTRLTGLIDTQADRDWHRFATHQGETYTFTLSGDGSASELGDVRLILRDGAGNILQNVGGSSATISYTATSSGTVYLDVQGYYTDSVGRYVLSSVSNAPVLNGTTGANVLRAGSSNTSMSLYGGNDWAYGGTGNDRIFGGSGNDTVYGSAGSDRLYGGDHADYLSGGSEGDWLEGGAGNDILRGGSGSDAFAFRSGAGVDEIVDFQDGADRIHIIGGPSSIAGISRVQVGDDVRISYSGVTVYVNSITVGELTSADFLFS